MQRKVLHEHRFRVGSPRVDRLRVLIARHIARKAGSHIL